MKLLRLVIPILAGVGMAVGTLTAFARGQAAPASPPAPLAVETDLTTPGPGDDSAGGAENMHADASGRLWISQDADSNANVRVFDPATHAYTLYTGLISPNDAQLGPDGNVWLFNDVNHWLQRLDPASGTVTTWSVPALSEPSLAIDTNNNIWTLYAGLPGMSRFNPNSNQLCTIALPDNGSSSFEVGGFLSEHGGALWLGDAVNSRLARITNTSDVSPTYTFWPVATSVLSSTPSGISFAPNGDIWFSDEMSGTIGRLETGANRLTLFIPPGGYVAQKVDYFLGKLWFTGQTELSGSVGYLDPATATVTGTTPVVITPTTVLLSPSCVDAGAGLTFTAGISTGVSVFRPLLLTTTVDAQGIAYGMPISSQPAALVRFGPYLWLTDQGRNTLVEVVYPTNLYLPLVTK